MAAAEIAEADRPDGAGDADDFESALEEVESVVKAELESVVKSARSRTATTVAKLVKVIARDHDDDQEDEDHTVRVEVGVSDDDGADVAVHQVDGSVEVLIAPKARPARSGDGSDEQRGDASGRGDDETPLPDLDADQLDDAEAEEARRAEVRAVTAELRSLVRQRHDLGLPMPQTLTAWLLREPGDGSTAEQLHPVGGSSLGGV